MPSRIEGNEGNTFVMETGVARRFEVTNVRTAEDPNDSFVHISVSELNSSGLPMIISSSVVYYEELKDLAAWLAYQVKVVEDGLQG